MATPKFMEIVVARPFLIVEHEFAGQVPVGIKSRRETVVGEKIKFDAAFAHEVIGAQKAYVVGTPEADEILAAAKAEKPAKKAE
jgi:hypothetical protein